MTPFAAEEDGRSPTSARHIGAPADRCADTDQEERKARELKATLTSSAPAGHDPGSRVVALEGAGRFQGEAFELGMRGGSLLAPRGQEEP